MSSGKSEATTRTWGAQADSQCCLPHPLATDAGARAPRYRPPLWLRNGHVQSIWSTLFRKVDLAEPESEVIATSDNDELHLDWYRQGSDRLAILCHGLEGNSRRPYMRGMARALLSDGWDVLAWNFRSCGGVMNRQPGFYHSGATGDLARVVQHGLGDGYLKLVLSGFSMGGNLVLLYIGDQGAQLDCRIVGAATFSVPCDLAGSARMLALPSRRLYMKRFLTDLRAKMKTKARQFPDLIDVRNFDAIRNFRQFDDRYTAPLHGFHSAEDYWARCSAVTQLRNIKVPALMVNALDDPFLSPSCFPQEPATLGAQVRLETPKWGGHVGFVERSQDNYYWSERRAVAFFRQIAG